MYTGAHTWPHFGPRSYVAGAYMDTHYDWSVFVRQGILLQVIEMPCKASRSARSRLASFAARPSGKSAGANCAPDCHTQVARTSSAALNSPAYHLHHHHHHHHNQAHCDSQAKELVRQCFLFTNHLLLCTRTKDGKLHLLEVSLMI